MPKKKNNNRKNTVSRPKGGRSFGVGTAQQVFQPIPAARAAIIAKRRPQVRSSTNGVEVAHSELCGEVSMNFSAFSLTPLSAATPGYDINPRCAALFPWLSRIAANYEQYRFSSLRFRLVSAQPSTASGRVYMAVDYDYDDPVPTTLSSMMSNHTALDASVWQEVALDVDAADLHKDMPWKYVLSPKRLDPEPRTVFGGFLLIGGAGMAATTTYNLWVDYVCRLQIPQLDTETYFDANPPETACTAVTFADGTGAFVGSPPILASPPGVEEVVPGMGTTPVLARGSVLYTAAWDLASSWVAEIGVKMLLMELGVTPANVLLKAPAIKFDIFDTAGALVLQIASDSLYALRDTIGPQTAGEINTVSKNLVARAILYVNAIRSDYPTARYIVPFFSSNLVIGAGYSGTWFRGWY